MPKKMLMARPAALLRHFLRRARSDHGFSLVELLAVMVIMSAVMTGVIALYISGVNTQATLTANFQAQTALHVGLDKIRADVHLACAQIANSTTSVTLSLPPCNAPVSVTWCTRGSGSAYSLYRVAGSTCTGGTSYADFITSGSIFTYYAQNSPTGSNVLPRLHVDLTVNPTPTIAGTRLHVIDDLVFRNGPRQP
jgi:prepilin-type N-terminal cleavage/methylation domain-containing protein